MKIAPWIILGIAGVGIAVVVVWYLQNASKAAILARCAALKAELARIRTQGGDVSRANELQAQIATCNAEAAAAGFVIDYKAEALVECDLIQTQIDQEWEHYKATATEDAIKRNNGRGQVLRLGENLARCYGSLVDTLDNSTDLRALRSKVNYALSQAIERRNCFNDRFPEEGNTKPGCSRYGVNEPTHLERALDEDIRVVRPLRAVARSINERISALARRRIARNAATAASGAAARGITA